MVHTSSYNFHIGCILKVLIYIEEHLNEPISLEEMAKIARISPYYFHRLFRAYVGETVADYSKRIRLQRAAERLQYSDTPITDIALDTGYETPSSFTKAFNQVMNHSPRQYRKKMQPVIRSIIERTHPSKKKQFSTLKPEYVTRQDESVLFIRKTGDYQVTASEAFTELVQYLKAKKLHSRVLSFYCMGLDDPLIVGRSHCRFDACVSLSEPVASSGVVGQKILPGGRFALFIIRGPYSEIEESLLNIFRFWYPTSKLHILNFDPICELVAMNDASIPDTERITKLYIPIEKI
jgi:AraC family transcriptional regulator